jgi:hypothetical protein
MIQDMEVAYRKFLVTSLDKATHNSIRLLLRPLHSLHFHVPPGQRLLSPNERRLSIIYILLIIRKKFLYVFIIIRAHEKMLITELANGRYVIHTVRTGLYFRRKRFITVLDQVFPCVRKYVVLCGMRKNILGNNIH